MELRIFYDSACPLCSNEMQQLKQHDRLHKIELADLNQDGFAEKYPHIDLEKANKILHAETNHGEILLGLDVTAKAWALTGKHQWVQLLRLPCIKPLADVAYLGFARHRYKLSYLLTGKQRCEDGSCSIK
ncbi:DUF393 domain-containing protein [Shewanella sp. 5_MG-2023]|uniref:thiol-disulfide oxidoreductase DCC family protein n=1 Tax=Shewanella sp. 5_MG-2023 TaxID=3062656 RepID=UPI0026E2DCED|nr:DUF393 domain-containing protein [Shewanella sp. 5_MG-2023]MDO6638690.1 DUF393 domain-containing protein [Shewanella sp. 5_MG-2023]